MQIESAFLSIYDGGSEKDSQLSVLTGNTLPTTISSTGNQFFITFASNGNGNVAGKGFSASIEFGKKGVNFFALTFPNLY